ncbi:MAG: ABC transporter ATP-binding protein [Pseudomonadota bacterium]
MIRLENVSKAFKTKGGRKVILSGQTYEFSPGYSYGLLGVNGAGKSTTMRILAGSELPDSGRVHRKRRISWPLGFAAGFNMTMSGRENLKFVARAYGEDWRRVFNFVADFAEIGDYMNSPLSEYSSGMLSRFAFGLSMAIEFECYLVDEITSVGDQRFQQRCREAFTQRRAVADIIMISHDMGTIEQYCDRGALLVDGKLMHFDTVEGAVSAYYRLNR